MSEVATYLKVGTTAIVLAMIEDDALGEDWLLANPVAAIRQVSHDPSLTRTIMLRDGRRATALEIQWGLLERARKYEQLHGLACVDETVGRDVLRRWEQVLTGLEHDTGSVAHWVDWVAKRRLVDGYARAPRPRPGSRPAEGDRPAVPRPAAGQEPGGQGRAGDDHRRRRRRVGDHRAADEHPGLLPRALPRQVPRRDRRGELGLDRVRRRPRAAAASSDDGAIAWNGRPRG